MKRSKHEIRADMLRVAEMGVLKTYIVYQANLNFDTVKKHLQDLIDSGRLIKIGKRYTTTSKGYNYIRNVEALK